MNMQSDHEVATKIARLLDQGTREIDAATAARLLEVRKQALAHYNEQAAPAWIPQWAGSAASRITGSGRYNLGMIAATVAFVAVFAVALTWQSMTGVQTGSEVAELDAGLLTDDLPIGAYLDKGFDSWLKRQ